MAIDLRAVTYNIHSGIGMDGRLDLDRIADLLERTGADLIGLQEVDRHRRESTDYEDQIGRLAAALDVESAYGAALTAPKTMESDGEPREYGIAVLSRFPILDHVVYGLPHGPDAERRVLLETRVDVEGTPVTFATTHFGLSADDRRRQAEAIVERSDAIATPRLLVGDINAGPDSSPLEVLTQRFRDVGRATGIGTDPTFPSPYVQPAPDGPHLEVYEPDRRLDYVLADSDFDPIDAKVVESLASDHSAVVADLELRE